MADWDRRLPVARRIVGDADRKCGFRTGDGESERPLEPGMLVLGAVGDPDMPLRVRIVGLAALTDDPGKLDRLWVEVLDAEG